MTTFANLGLSPATLKAVEKLGYEHPTPVQEQAIPLVLKGRDVLAAAKTGTGKTAAFSLPALDTLVRTDLRSAPSLLVITPTRELAMQIEEVATVVAKGRGLRAACVVGGVKIEAQIEKLSRGVDVLIATPGRLIDLMNQKAVNLSHVKTLVLDEADRMLDMGFLPSVKRIVETTPKTRQTLLFSATIDASVLNHVETMLNDPAVVQISSKGETADTVEQYLVHVPHALKPDLLQAVLKQHGASRVIVFARTRHRADTACRKLKRAGYAAEALHSDKSQNQRKRALDNFAAGKTDILVATDVLARGIDVDEVAYVVNYDAPTQPEDYVHRIGRTGRAGAEGFALTFVCPENKNEIAAIEKLIKKSIPDIEIPGFDLEAAAQLAAQRATRANARRDPELAEAAREQAKKEKRKTKAKAKGKVQAKTSLATSHKTSHAASQPTAHKTSLATSHKTSHAASQPTAHKTSHKAQRKMSSGASPASAHKTSSALSPQSAHKPSRNAARSSSSKSDLRPGRAQRAAVAAKRNAQNSRVKGNKRRSRA